MDSNMSTAFAHRGSSGSASTSSSGTGTGTGSGGRVAVVGVTRSVRLRKRGSSGFGFSLRGGREHAAGFYVSEVQPGGEAHRNGLRVGDQIIRVNGYPVEDAVHQEVALLARTQQVLVLKIRSVGMIPVKDNPNDPVTWHMVQQQCENGSNILPLSTEIRVRVMVGSKGRLGCGVCRGPNPGLTVQGTREGGAARAAGLRPGDVIVKCNGHRLTDVPFEKAVEVMRGSGVLDLVVNRPTYFTPDPGEAIFRGSNGYDSGNSSLLESSSLPPALQGPPPPQAPIPGRHVYPQNQGPCTRNPTRPRTGSREVQWADIDGKGDRTCCPLASSTESCSSSGSWRHIDQMAEWTRKPNNTTVIRVNQRQGDPSPYLGKGPHLGYRAGDYEDEEPLYDPVAVSRGGYESHYFEADGEVEGRRPDGMDANGVRSPLYDPVAGGYHDPKDDLREGSRLAELQFIQKQKETETKTITTVEVHHAICPPPPPCMPPPGSCKWPAGQYADSKPPMSAVGGQMGSTMSMGSTGSTETESSLESSCGKDSASTSSSSSTCEPASSSSYVSVSARKLLDDPEPPNNIPAPPVAPPFPAAAANIDLSSAIAQELQRRAQKARATQDKSKAQEVRNSRLVEPSKISPAHEQKITHDKLMEEFKRAHQRMFNCKRNGEANGADEQAAAAPNNVSTPAAETSEQERRVNGVVRRQNPGAPTPPPPPPRGVTAQKPKTNASDDAVEMQSIESFKLKEPQSVATPKPPSTYFPASRDESDSSTRRTGSPTGSGDTKKQQQPTVPMAPSMPNGAAAPVNTVVGKGKVAIRIGAYSGEAKAPSKLDFLGGQPPTGTPTPTPIAKGVETTDSAPVASRLQNELAATLQRSNLRKKTDGENATARPVSNNAASPTRFGAENPAIITQSNVERLAAVLSNKVTIKINTIDSVSRQD
ncbi:uncharacterized protein LOC124185374 [Neodiprion fabricii]|uniref:uncharacterized protein LOC124185374 n=1 Tax=Neodiprion fabricii TaxID=2872261 RepID=UPI001ED8DCB1|nr:uncharacterized protein LOC124185374 [Neodiprion fabricii]